MANLEAALHELIDGLIRTKSSSNSVDLKKEIVKVVDALISKKTNSTPEPAPTTPKPRWVAVEVVKENNQRSSVYVRNSKLGDREIESGYYVPLPPNWQVLQYRNDEWNAYLKEWCREVLTKLVWSSSDRQVIIDKITQSLTGEQGDE